MSQAFARVDKETDKVEQLEKALQKIRQTVIYVGIAKGSDQEYRKGQPISNCDLGFVHEKGSPSARIPPRPFLVPGVSSVKDKLKAGMQRAAKSAMDGDMAGFSKSMEQTALKAQVAVPNYVRDHNGDFEPLKPRTVKNRLAKSGKLVGNYDRIRQQRGIDQDRMGDASGITILMDTGQLVGAVRGVVVEEK